MSRCGKPADLPSVESSKSFWHSEPSSLLLGHRSTRDLPPTADVVVIGSGITGTSIAYHLLNDGDSNAKKPNVVMLEAREACWGATGRNGGHCQPIFFEHPNEPEIGRFELDNFHALGGLINDKHIECEFVVQPGVRAIYSEQHLTTVQQAVETMKTTAPDLAAMMRFTTSKQELAELRIPTALGAIVTDVAARMWPYKFVSHILEELLTSAELDGTFNLQTLTPVTSLSPTNQCVEVITNRGIIFASKVVLATNAYTSHLLPQFADLIVPCRGQMSSLVPFYSIAGENRLKTSLGFLGDGLDDYLIQRPTEKGGHLMFGGGRQFGSSISETDDSVVDSQSAHYLQTKLVEIFKLPEGKKACTYCAERKINCHVPDHIMMLNDHDLRCTNCIASSQPSCEQPLNTPTPEMRATHMWSGIMGFSRDDLPWIGPVPSTPHTYISGGYTGHGMPNTWLCGKSAALLVQNALNGGDEQKAMEHVKKVTGLPDGYVITNERIKAARALPSVQQVDWTEKGFMPCHGESSSSWS
ncbi:Putative FAD dependent oxidoreductase, FAD/NAD(P)-binding domain superfamily [Septoria linicola]|uniref:FAD dependent oxidoreductase, FAD/NAD(P)-binding domain superfamily n=1 Tax=Septoria linicola TaxID=215465 RepID=A0A9Q9EK57_9PEZI|nr:putative FAD dependent oxidoreductase, FAD/NAD(P)-binding domain superfamily [Septoria linicola]USW52904.1 Putative FAD dependent oxidoreductase, FAD/NAD(P)-binding domain superfamily [Septoria linicola]